MFQSESILYSYMNIKEFFAQNRRDIWSLSDTNGIQSQEHLIQKQTLSHLAKLATRLSCVVITYLYYGFGCILLSYYLRVSEWIYTPNCLNFDEIVARNMLEIWSLSENIAIWAFDHLVHQRTLNHLDKLDKVLSWVVRTYKWDAFHSMLLSHQVLVSEWMYTL